MLGASEFLISITKSVKMDLTIKSTCLLLVVLLAKVSTCAPVQNDGPYLSSNTQNNQQQTYLPPIASADQTYIPSSSNNNVVAHENQNIYLHLPQEQQQQQQPYPYYPYPQPKRKHYKIILVRPPPQPTQPPAPQPEIEEQTIVYVLVKKPDEPKIEIEQPVYKPSKPEVYFIKYQTKNEEGTSSQPQLQASLSTTATSSNAVIEQSPQYLPPTSQASKK